MEQKIRRLSAVSAPAGFEKPAAAEISAMLTEGGVFEAADISTDALGNLAVYKRSGLPDAKLVMITAHMDEVGLIVTGITEDGFLVFDALGGLPPRQLPALEVTVLPRDGSVLFGVVGVMPPHVLSAEEQDKPLDIDKLFIDVGLSKEEAEKTIKRGTPAVYASGALSLRGSVLSAKALDNRASCAVLIDVMLKLPKLNVDVCAMFTVAEELGLRGAGPGVYGVQPDCCVVLDATFGKDPDSPAAKTFELGAGPAVGVGPNMDREMTDLLFKAAEGLPHQTEVLAGSSGTDAWVIQVSRGGIPTGLLSIPVRYMHSPSEVMDVRDAEIASEIVVKLLNDLGGASRD